jgi:glycosyltransferase involved in cell wall biosynthesis
MKQILHIIGGMDRAGAETFLRNICLNINQNKYAISILTFLPPRNGKKYEYQDELEKIGIKFFHIKDRRFSNPVAFYADIKRIVRDNQFKIVHSHNDLMSGIILSAAKSGGAKTLISHAHSTSNPNISSWPKSLAANLLRKRLLKIATIKIACGEAAGRFLFGNTDFKIVPNGIDINSFKYNYAARQRIRKKYKINNDSLVLLNVARLDTVKNQSFLIDIFDEIHKLKNNTELVFVGSGALEAELKARASTCKNQSKIHFLGPQKDMPDFYSAADLFLLPSLFEGLPTVCIEAQANGLSCILSDAVSREAILLPTSKSISLSNKNDWIKSIVATPLRSKTSSSETPSSLEKLDIKTTALKLEKIYDSI